MKAKQEKYDELIAQVEDLQFRLNEAETVIDAIRNGEVNALVVKKNNEPQIYTLKSADQTYRIFIEKMNDGAVTLNRDGIIVYCNSAFSDMMYLPVSGLLGTPFLSVIPPQHTENVSKLLEKAWYNDSKAEITLPNANGLMPVLLSLSPLEIDGGLSLSIIITDVSFQKEAQQQKKTLEQKDEFISIASHELKTPVTSIKGYLQLLRYHFKEEGNDKAAEMLSKADVQVNKLSVLIAELLDVKKIETGQLKYHEETFDLCTLVKEMMEELISFAGTHKLTYKITGNCMVHGDLNKISQVISNLIENAVKYSPAKREIIIEVSPVNGNASFSVQDFGMGIPKNDQAKIFERFYRVGGLLENTYSGLGLGLYISAEIVKRHHGSITVESEYGKGSTFTFELPLIKHA